MAEQVVQKLNSEGFQVELFEIAKESNSILYLPTGYGQSFIAELVLKHYINVDSNRIFLPIEKGGVKSFFLVNTASSVHQRAKKIESQTTLTVGKFTGDMGIDSWDDELWRVKINEKQVLVMTTQIFLNLLKRKQISLKNVNLLVVEECHKAVSNHPLKQVMQYFKDLTPIQQPRVLGLTATLLNGNVKPHNVEQEIRNLEITFNSRIITNSNEDMSEFCSQESKLSFVENDCCHIFYALSSEVLAHLKAILSKEERCEITASSRCNNHELIDKSRKMNKLLVNLIDDLDFNIKALGIYEPSLTALANLVKLQQIWINVKDEKFKIMYQMIFSHLEYLRKYLEIGMSGLSDFDKFSQFSSDKVKKLLLVLKSVNSSDSALLFVKRRSSVKILYHLIIRAAEIDKKLSHLKCNFLVGRNVDNPFGDTQEKHYLQKKQNAIVLNEFNQGKINVLIATVLIEESMNISKCKYVIMFDSIDLDFEAYIQSKKRVLDKNSHYILMLPKGDEIFLKKYCSYNAVEETLKKVLCERKLRLKTPPAMKEIDSKNVGTISGLDPYSPKVPNGPEVKALSARPTINRQFSPHMIDKLTEDNHAQYKEEENYKYPLEATNPVVGTGSFQSSTVNAKQSAAVKACKILNKSKDLDDEHLLPVHVEVMKKTCDLTPNFDESAVFEKIVDGKPVTIGTKNYKHTYTKNWANALTKCMPDSHKEIYLHLIEIKPMYNPPLDNYRLWMVHEFLSSPYQFAILSSKDLPSLAPFPLYMSEGELEAYIHKGSKIKLNDEQIKEISDFHYTIFDSVLQVAKPFMIKDSTNSHNAYLVAPVVKHGSNVRIDWNVIEECKVTFLSPCNKPTKNDRMNIHVTDENYFGRIITPWYLTVPSQKYIVTKVCYDMSEDTQFPTEKFESYKEYFKEKYKIEPYLKGQPLLEVRAISSRLDSIKPRALNKQQEQKNKEENEEFEVWLLPEFCTVYPLPGEYWLKAQLLPSALHRVSQLCLADELRCCIAKETGIGTIEPTPHWLKLKEDVSLQTKKDPNQDKPQALKPSYFNQNSCKVNVPDFWTSGEEPVDVERHLESITLFDVFTHENIIQKSFTKTLYGNANISLSNGANPTRAYKNKVVNPPSLELLKKNKEPQQVILLQALTAANSNDVINSERFETLGDSFLKFVVSVILFETQGNFTAGHLKNIKSSIVGHKNLYFCGKNRSLEAKLGVDEFLPNENWVPPRFHVPRSVKNLLKMTKINVNCLYSVRIPDADRKCEEMTPVAEDLYKDAMLNFSEDLVLLPQNCSFTNQIVMTDKNISGAVKAVVGVYLESSGILGALKVMSWFGVTDPNLSTPEVITGRSKSADRGSGNPCIHLHQPEDLESILNYKFKDRSSLLQALTHSSYTYNSNPHCYQTLEFLGHAVIDFLITVHIFEKCSKLTPSELTDLRSALVNNVTLACISARNNFHKFLLYHSYKLNTSILSFLENQEERNHVVDKDTLFLVEEGDVNIDEAFDVPKALGDVLKSLIGAIYLDSEKNLDVTWTVLFNLMKTEIETFFNDVPKNHVKVLHESGSLPQFHLVPEYLPPMVKVTVEIILNNQPQQFYGFGQNKHQAKRAAAKFALRHLQSVLYD